MHPYTRSRSLFSSLAVFREHAAARRRRHNACDAAICAAAVRPRALLIPPATPRGLARLKHLQAMRSRAAQRSAAAAAAAAAAQPQHSRSAAQRSAAQRSEAQRRTAQCSAARSSRSRSRSAAGPEGAQRLAGAWAAAAEAHPRRWHGVSLSSSGCESKTHFHGGEGGGSVDKLGRERVPMGRGGARAVPGLLRLRVLVHSDVGQLETSHLGKRHAPQREDISPADRRLSG